MKKVVGVVIGLLPVSAFGECVPVPDCASIGYTETSCDGGSLKCPFDSSKLKCFPCDSSFRYSCDGENVTGAVGDACNNKYVACNCMEGTIFINGECVCDTSCSVGNIYYSDGTCSSCVDEAKTPVGIVVKDKELVTSINFIYSVWANIRVDLSTLPNIVVEDYKLDMDGYNNTAAIVEYYGKDADITQNAAVFCYNYNHKNLIAATNKWYLPASGELYNYYYMNKNKINLMLSKLGVSGFNTVFWSSTEAIYTSALTVSVDNGRVDRYGKDFLGFSVTCFLNIATL